MGVQAFFMDKYPVTTTKYAKYLAATSFQPTDTYNWLKNWNLSQAQLEGTTSPQPPAAIADLPVTYVSLNEARAYCSWAGGRLPHSWEWQYAAQGMDGRLFPWGPN